MVLKNMFMGPKLMENSKYSVQANNRHVMVLPEFIVKYIVKYHLGTMSPNIKQTWLAIFIWAIT